MGLKEIHEARARLRAAELAAAQPGRSAPGRGTPAEKPAAPRIQVMNIAAPAAAPRLEPGAFTEAAPPTKLSSLGRGAAQGATLNFADELAGVGTAVRSLFGPSRAEEPFAPGFVEAYRMGRDITREEDDAARAANPKSFIVGEIAGGVVPALVGGAAAGKVLSKVAPLAARIPLADTIVTATKAARPAVQAALGGAVGGAAQGAAAGLGSSTAQSTGTNLLDAVKSGALGGVVGGAVGGLASGATGAVKRYLTENGKDADRLRVLTAMGATGGSMAKPQVLKQAEMVPAEMFDGDHVASMADAMRKHGMSSTAGTTKGLLEAAREAQRQADDVIQSVILDVDRQGTRKVDINAFAARLERAAKEMRDNPELDGVAAALMQRAATYRQRFPDGVTMANAQELVTSLGDQVNWVAAANGQRLPNAARGSLESTRAMREQMDALAHLAADGDQYRAATAGAKQVFPDGVPARPVDAYRAARRVHQVADIVGENAEESVGRAAKRNALSLTDGVASGLGGAAGGLLFGKEGATAGALAAPILLKLAAPRAAALKATKAELAREWAASIQNDPAKMAKLGPYGEMLLRNLLGEDEP